VAAYGYQGRLTAAVGFNQAKWLESYQDLIEAGASFPPDLRGVDEPADGLPVAAQIPGHRARNRHATVSVTGHDPSELRAELLQTITQGGELHQIVADDDFDAPSGGLWHGPDIATFSRKHLTRTGYHDGESAGRDFSQPCRLYCDNQGRRLTARAAASFTLRNRAR